MQRVFAAREDRGDGLDLRTLRYGTEEVVSRIYFAVRDRWWRTVPMTVRGHSREATPTGFVLEIDAVSAWESHPFAVRLTYAADGEELVAGFTATAAAAFPYCRIGFCVLYPMDTFAGLPVTSWLAGEPTEFAFPTEIVTRAQTDQASVRFHRPFDALSARLPSGTRVRYGFEGENFEFEDQRNWTDNSYKAYSVAPPGGWPPDTVAGGRYAQRLRITVTPADLAGSTNHGAPGGGFPGAPVDRPADGAIRLGAPVGIVPSIDLYRGRVSPRSYRPGGGFQEFNSRRPDAAALAGRDSIELAVNGAVHAADDDSVQEGTAAHGLIVTQARELSPGLPVRLAAVSFADTAGDWRTPEGRYSADPPPLPLTGRLIGGYGAAWVIASAARALPAGPDLVRYLHSGVPLGSPAGRTVARLRSLHGRPLLAVTAPAPLAALAVLVDGRIALAVANPSPDPASFRLPDGRAATVDGFASAWYDLAPSTMDRAADGAARGGSAPASLP
jgi:hypothetical protein